MIFSDLVAFLPRKTAKDISNRWNDALNPNFIKGKWTTVEGKLQNIYNSFIIIILYL